MTKIMLLALLLSSTISVAQAIEVPSAAWAGKCFDAESSEDQETALYSARYYTDFLLKPSLDGAVVENWIRGRSLVSVNRTTDGYNKEICVYNFSRVGIEPLPSTKTSSFGLQAEVRHLQRPFLTKKIDIVTSLVSRCNTSTELNLDSKVSDLLQRNYRLVSVLTGHAENQCLYIFVQNFNSEKNQ